MAIAINGSSNTITGLAVGGLPDASVTAADLASGLASQGITLADQWRISSGFTGATDPISNNWERNDNGWSQLGAGFSAPSSGIWSFPSTGYYWIQFQANYYWTSSTPYIAFAIQYTSNNSSYADVSSANTNINNVADTTYGSASCDVMLKITDVSNQKIKTKVAGYVGNESWGVNGSTSKQSTGLTFIRMGDI